MREAVVSVERGLLGLFSTAVTVVIIAVALGMVKFMYILLFML